MIANKRSKLSYVRISTAKTSGYVECNITEICYNFKVIWKIHIRISHICNLVYTRKVSNKCFYSRTLNWTVDIYIFSVERYFLYVWKDFSNREFIIRLILKFLYRRFILNCEARNKYGCNFILYFSFCLIEYSLKCFILDVTDLLGCLRVNCILKISFIRCIKISYDLTKSQSDIWIVINLFVYLIRNCCLIICFSGIYYVIKKVVIFSGILNKLVKLIVAVIIPIINNFSLCSVIECCAFLNGINYFTLCGRTDNSAVFPNRLPIGSCKAFKVICYCLKRFGLAVRSNFSFNVWNRFGIKIVSSLNIRTSGLSNNLINDSISELCIYIFPNAGINCEIITVWLLCPILVVNKLRTFFKKLNFNFSNDSSVKGFVIYILANILIKLFRNKIVNLCFKRSIVNRVGIIRILVIFCYSFNPFRNGIVNKIVNRLTVWNTWSVIFDPWINVASDFILNIVGNYPVNRIRRRTRNSEVVTKIIIDFGLYVRLNLSINKRFYRCINGYRVISFKPSNVIVYVFGRLFIKTGVKLILKKLGYFIFDFARSRKILKLNHSNVNWGFEKLTSIINKLIKLYIWVISQNILQKLNVIFRAVTAVLVFDVSRKRLFPNIVFVSARLNVNVIILIIASKNWIFEFINNKRLSSVDNDRENSIKLLGIDSLYVINTRSQNDRYSVFIIRYVTPTVSHIATIRSWTAKHTGDFIGDTSKCIRCSRNGSRRCAENHRYDKQHCDDFS